MIPIQGCFLAALAGIVLAGCGSTLDESLTSLEVGDCIENPGFGALDVSSVETVDCGDATAVEVVEQFDIPGDYYPGQDEVDRLSTEGCPADTTFSLYPTEDSWEKTDDRLVICFE